MEIGDHNNAYDTLSHEELLEVVRDRDLTITALRKEARKHREKSYIDRQTGLKSSKYYEEVFKPIDLEPAIGGERRSEISIFGYLDVDGLKPVNDELGHKIADRYIEIVAEVLKNESRNTDIVGRIHDKGDEFYVLLRLSRIEAIDTTKIIESFRERCRKQIKTVSEGLLDLSCGFVNVRDFSSVDSAETTAEYLMYEDKNAHRSFSE